MKKLFKFLVLFLAISSIGFAQNSILDIGTGTSYFDSNTPFSNYWENNKSQTLYLASEFGPYKTIDSIGFNIEQVADTYTALNNFIVLIKPTTLPSMPTSGGYVDMTGADTLFYSASHTLATATGWAYLDVTDYAITIPSNYIIEIVWGDLGGHANTCYRNLKSDGGVTRTLYGFSDYVTPPDCGISSSYYNNLRLIYSPITHPADNLVGVAAHAPMCASSAATIEMDIFNFGSAAQSAYSAMYSIDNGATWSTPELITTPINPDSTYTYTFTTTADMSAPGTYNVKAVVILPGDVDNTNDTAVTSVTYGAVYSTFPYLENFDSNVDGIYGSGFANGWAATPDAYDVYAFGWRTETTTTYTPSTGPSGPAGGTGAYVYLATFGGSNGSNGYLVSPCLDFSAQDSTLQLSFDYHMYGTDMGRLYLDVFNAGVWTTVDFLIGEQQTSSADAWKTRKVVVPNSIEKIRFHGIKGSDNESDMAIDNISIDTLLNNDLEIVDLEYPSSNCGLGLDTIKITVKNNGSTIPAVYAVSYSIDNGATWSPEVTTIAITTGSTEELTFSVLADFSSFGAYDIMGAVTLAGDQETSNDTMYFGQIMNKPLISSYPSVEDFEGTNYWTSGGVNSSWELGAPANTIINSAASGSNAWVTSLTGTYNISEESYVESPCYDMSSLNNPLIDINVWWSSELSTDGAALLYSLDDGSTWLELGNHDDWMNWYNDYNISGLTVGSGEGWCGDQSTGNGSNGWVNARHLAPELFGQANVKFRMYFGSDYAGAVEGFAFDDFTVREGALELAITEINYNPAESGTDSTEYIEWYNYGSDAVNIENFTYNAVGVTDILPAMIIKPGDYFVSAFDSLKMVDFYGYTGAIEWASGGLSNSAEPIALYTPWGMMVDSVNYDDSAPWSTLADQGGHSLVFCEQNIGILDNNDGANWNVSSNYVDSTNSMAVYGSPGKMDSVCLYIDLVIVNPLNGSIYAVCDFSASDTVPLSIENIGNLNVVAGDTIFAWYQLDMNPVVADTVVLTSALHPGNTLSTFFAQTVDLSAVGIYNAHVYFNYENDMITANDTAHVILDHYEILVNLGVDDTICYTDLVTLDAGNAGATFTWSTGDTTQTLNPTYTGSDVGSLFTYSVDVTDSNYCMGSDTIVLTIDVCTGINDPEMQVAIYPNPADQTINLDFSQLENGTYLIDIMNMAGQVVIAKELVLGDHIVTIDLSDLSSGIYNIRITGQNDTFNGMFIKK